MNTRPRFHRQRGVTLLELLCILVLIVVFVMVYGLTFRTTMRATREAHIGQEQHRIQARALRRLRADTWAAYEVRVGDEGTLLIRLNEERSIVWQVLEDENVGDATTYLVRRAAFKGRKKLDERTWPLREDRLLFTLDGGVLVVTREGTSLGPARELRLYSQMAVFAGAVGGGDER